MKFFISIFIILSLLTFAMTGCFQTKESSASGGIQHEDDTIYLNHFNSCNDDSLNGKLNLCDGYSGKGARITSPLTIDSNKLSGLDKRGGFVEAMIFPEWETGQKEPKVRNIISVFFSDGTIKLQKIGDCLNLNSNFGKYKHEWNALTGKKWKQNKWHHIAVSWSYADGFTMFRLFVDKQEVINFMNNLITGKIKSITLGEHGKFASAGVIIDEFRVSERVKYIKIDNSFLKDIPISAKRLKKTPNYCLWSERPTKKVFDKAPLQNMESIDAVALSAAGGEYESFQIVATPNLSIKDIKVSFSDLTGDGIISKKMLSVCVPENVVVAIPSGKFGKHGKIPDPLPHRQKIDFNKNTNNSLWFTLFVPPGSKPGKYSGKIFLEAEGFKETVKLKLKVWDFDLPKKPSIKTSANACFFQNIAKFENLENAEELVQKCNKEMIAHRYVGFSFFPHYIQHVNKRLKINFNKLEKWGNFLIDDLGFTLIPLRSIKYIDHRKFHTWPKETTWSGIKIFSDEANGTLNPEFKASYRKSMEPLIKFLKEKGWLKYQILFFIDEMNWEDPETLKKTVSMTHFLKDAHKDVKIIMTKYPHEDLIDYVDIWCINGIHFKGREKIIEKARKKGADIWIYQNDVPLIDYPVMRTRMFPWFLKKYKFDGHLSWWGLSAYHGNDPWLKKWTTKAGDGVLVYPGRNDFEKNISPITSIRWEAFRDGLEDYEYITLLEKLTDALSKSEKIESKEIKKARKLHKKALNMIFGWYGDIATQNYCIDSEKLYSLRSEMGEEIEKLFKLTKERIK